MSNNLKKAKVVTISALLFGLFASRPVTASHEHPLHQVCGAPKSIILYAGKTINSGSVSVWNDEDGNLYVKFQTANGWVMSESHLAVSTSLSGIPQTTSGNPKVGNFPYKATHNPPVTEYLYTIHADEIGYTFGTTLYIAAHAVVQKIGADGQVIQQETGWGNGSNFPGKNWAMYFTYVVQTCSVPQIIKIGDFRTQTQGGWGTECKGNNPGCYRDANFDSVFDQGMVIGDITALDSSLFHALFTSSHAVEEFLPQGGTPAPFSLDRQDPTTTEAGVLAGQVAALTLSVNFDLANANFGASSTNLKDLVVVENSGTACSGMTVETVLWEANRVLAGAISSFTPSEINACASAINENFVDGTKVGTYLRLP